MCQSNRTRLCIVGLLALMLVVIDARSAAGDPGSPPIIRFTPYAQNPILSRTSTENWGGDCGAIFAPRVVKHQERYYLFYTGSCNRQAQPAAIGFATSTDGIHWNKYEKNPILEPDGAGYDAMCVSLGVPVVDGDGWVMYYAGNSQPCAGPGRFIGRATATRPDSAWQRDPEPVLTAGKPGEWDEGFIMPHAVIRTEKGYVMYYSGGSEYLIPLPRLIGLATSPDGIVWTKHNDPATTQAPYATSDPILEIQDDGTTVPFSAWAIDVATTERGLEMFYSATCPDATKQGCPGFIGYATSADGVHWKTYRTPETLVLTPEQVNQDWAKHCICYPSVLKKSEGYMLYFTGCADALNDFQIGLATGTIEWKD